MIQLGNRKLEVFTFDIVYSFNRRSYYWLENKNQRQQSNYIILVCFKVNLITQQIYTWPRSRLFYFMCQESQHHSLKTTQFFLQPNSVLIKGVRFWDLWSETAVIALFKVNTQSLTFYNLPKTCHWKLYESL